MKYFILLAFFITQESLARTVVYVRKGVQEVTQLGEGGAVKGDVVWDEARDGPIPAEFLAKLEYVDSFVENVVRKVPKLDELGRPVLDENGEPVFQGEEIIPTRKLVESPAKKAAYEARVAAKEAEGAKRKKDREDAEALLDKANPTVKDMQKVLNFYLRGK